MMYWQPGVAQRPRSLKPAWKTAWQLTTILRLNKAEASCSSHHLKLTRSACLPGLAQDSSPWGVPGGRPPFWSTDRPVPFELHTLPAANLKGGVCVSAELGRHALSPHQTAQGEVEALPWKKERARAP